MPWFEIQCVFAQAAALGPEYRRQKTTHARLVEIVSCASSTYASPSSFSTVEVGDGAMCRRYCVFDGSSERGLVVLRIGKGGATAEAVM